MDIFPSLFCFSVSFFHAFLTVLKKYRLEEH